MTDKQLLKITMIDLARLAQLLGMNLQLALYPQKETDINGTEAEAALEAAGGKNV